MPVKATALPEGVTPEMAAKCEAMSDDDLLAAIMQHVNQSRFNEAGRDRAMTRAISHEACRRGWNLSGRKPASPSR